MILALFFTRGVSLEMWLDTGIFDREKMIYEVHLNKGSLKKVYWLTYGINDASIAEQLKSEERLHHNIVIIPMPLFFKGKWGQLIYSFFLGMIHYKCLKKVHLFKTNQMDGSWSAVISKFLHKKPLIVRTGYVLSVFVQKGLKSIFKLKLFELVERIAYRYADIGVITSRQAQEYICSKYSFLKEKSKIIGNFIDDKQFYPQNCKKYENRIIFVGRLSKQKNLFNLIEAISKTPLTLDIYGEGELQDELECWANRLNARVNSKGVVSNSDLPEILNRYRYFILPSFYEGMPKALLEAMACGLLCIGTNVDGINEVIEDEYNGFLAQGTDASSIHAVIKKAIGEQNTKEYRVHAVRTITNNFSLSQVINSESIIFDDLTC